MSLKGINNQPYFDMEKYINMDKFEELQPEILRGFAEARDLAKEGTWMRPGFTWDDCSYKLNWLPIPYAIDKFMALPDDDPIKVEGMKLYNNIKDHHTRNLFTRYLKMAVGAYDPYTYYFLWEEGDWNDRTAERKPTPEAKYFPGTVEWVNQMVEDCIFEHIGRVIFFCIEAGGIPFEHRDLDANNGVDVRYPHRNEFIHIRPNTKKAFYVWDPEKKNKIYLNTRAAWWNDQDWHGGEMTMEPSYALRIDGKFTEEFRTQLGINHLESY
jgi:hypothetical protein